MKDLSFRKIKNNTVLTKLKCGVCFVIYFLYFGFGLMLHLTNQSVLTKCARCVSVRFDPFRVPYKQNSSCAFVNMRNTYVCAPNI